MVRRSADRGLVPARQHSAPAIAGRDVRLHSIYAHGEEVCAARRSADRGCWSVNGSAALFAQRGAHATGVLVRGNTADLSRRRHERPHLAIQLDPRQRLRPHRAHGLTRRQTPQRDRVARRGHPARFARCRGSASGQRALAAVAARMMSQLALLHRANHVALFGLQFDASGDLLLDPSREELQSLAENHSRAHRRSPRRARVPPAGCAAQQRDRAA